MRRGWGFGVWHNSPKNNRNLDGDEPDYDGDYTDDAGDEPTIRCPYCRRDILEDSSRCPYCEWYISEEDHAAPGRPPWLILTALVSLGAAIWWLFMAF